ncbi:MAG: hypothetical protein ABJJ44_13540 [Paraglaciecola sp.]|uniref:hypothetical protein n=1 Tax=Paraglaciecola sp. TaxID=1920173 RepID=UPI0032972F43
MRSFVSCAKINVSQLLSDFEAEGKPSVSATQFENKLLFRASQHGYPLILF